MGPHESDEVVQGTSGSPEDQLDWEAARQHLRRVIASRVRGLDRDELEDLVQEGLVRLLRAVRGGEVRCMDALTTTIAQRVAIDCIRRRCSLREATRALETQAAIEIPAAMPTEQDAASLELLRFLILEFFRFQNAPCLDLAEAFFRKLSWKNVAELQGRAHTAILKQWSRCLEHLRQAMRKDGAPLARWAEDWGVS